MASRIRRHFPMVRFRDGQKLLFNPIQKSVVADRPEERVRLRMIEFLVREAGFSFNRMSTEIGIKSFTTDTSLRTDILCFDKLHRPLLLVECKSESVKLDEKAAIQIARYNRTVKAPYILLTNGHRDILFAVREDDSVDLIPELETVFPLFSDNNRDLTYWIGRNLWGRNTVNTSVGGEADGKVNESDSGTVDNFTTELEQHSAIGAEDETIDSDSEASSSDGLHEGTSKVISSFLDAFWGSEYSETQYLQLHLPEDFAEVSGIDRQISTFCKVFPRNNDGCRTALAIFGDSRGITRCLMITSNPESTPTWVNFEVHCNTSTLILQNGRIKKRDEKSVKIPDYLTIEVSASNTNYMDEYLYSCLAQLST